MKRAREGTLDRAEVLRHAYDASRITQAFIIPARVMDMFVRENASNVEKRPDASNAVHPVPAAFDRLEQLVETYAPFLDGMFSKSYASLRDLHTIFRHCYHYVPFETLLSELETSVTSAVQSLTKERTANEHIIYFLALPQSRLHKSSLWFNAYAWLHTNIKDIVDFVAPSMAAVKRFLALLDTMGTGTVYEAKVLYVDDMSYSGLQLSQFIDRERVVDPKRLTMVPLVPYLTNSARRHFLSEEVSLGGTGTNFQFFQTNIVSMPGDYIQAMEKKYPQRDIILQKKATTPADDKEVTYALRLMSILAETKSDIIFEHKMADYESVNWELFAQRFAAPGESGTSARALVTIGNGTQSIDPVGSKAFYTTLTWHFNATPISSSVPLANYTSVRATCATCHAPAVRTCTGCNLAFYCAEDECRATHMSHGYHAHVCGL